MLIIDNKKIEQTAKDRLILIFDWYKKMASQKNGRLVYMYYPETDIAVTDGSPIREIASIWDIEILSEFLNRQDLEDLIRTSLYYYSHYLVKRRDYLILDPDLLEEPSGIAHSAFMILSLIHSRVPDLHEKVRLFAEGILAQQRPDGSYKIYFGDEPDDGLEFYPGEAMLALVETYRMTREKKYLHSVERGFAYYKNEYCGKNGMERELLVFFANWQSQYCRQLYEETEKGELKEQIKNYLFELHDRIIDQGFYDRVKEYPEGQNSVEVACGLEGLNDAYGIALRENDERMRGYRSALCISIGYLLKAQCVQRCPEKAKGGFGLSLYNRTQRIDVTGHFVNALIKSIRNGVTC